LCLLAFYESASPMPFINAISERTWKKAFFLLLLLLLCSYTALPHYIAPEKPVCLFFRFHFILAETIYTYYLNSRTALTFLCVSKLRILFFSLFIPEWIHKARRAADKLKVLKTGICICFDFIWTTYSWNYCTIINNTSLQMSYLLSLRY